MYIYIAALDIWVPVSFAWYHDTKEELYTKYVSAVFLKACVDF